jgi:replicative DNA helicase
LNVPADRLPPQNIEAEQSVLGAILLDREAIATAVELLRPQDFYQDIHQLIFRAVANLYDAGRSVDVVTLAEELRKEGQLDRVGGATYLGTLARAVPTSANVRYYAEIVEAKAMLRNLISAGTNIVGRAYEATEDPKTLLDQAEQMIFDIGQHRIRKPYALLKTLLVKAYERLERLYELKVPVTGVPTAFAELDDITSGLQPSDLIILAGRPSQGKTTLAVNIARNVAVRHKLPVGLFSLEMSAEQLSLRFLASEGPFDGHRLRSGALEEKDFPRIAEAMGRLAEAPVYIDDSPSLSILELRARARRMKRDSDVALLIVDYLQLMRGTQRTENRQQEISEISRALKSLARELEIPVLALSQLSRAVEARESRRPQLSDLRESGAIEQDADVVTFIHFPTENTVFRDWKGYEYRTAADPEESGKRVLEITRDGRSRQFILEDGTDVAEIIIGKQRNGPVGSVCLTFIRKTGRFATLERYREAPPS